MPLVRKTVVVRALDKDALAYEEHDLGSHIVYVE